jgi:glutaredoxin
MKRINLAICLFFVVMSSIAEQSVQRDSLLLFTKPDCSNCQATKRQLTRAGIAYKEMNLNDDANPPIMLKKLAEKKYKGKIFLPVIFMNNQLYHPAYETKKGMEEMPLGDVVDTLLLKQKTGQLHFQKVTNVKVAPLEATVHDADCEIKTGPFYLICYDFNTANEAQEAMNNLVKQGYSFAGMLFQQGMFKVYCKLFLDKSVASSELVHMQESFKNAYLFQLP